MNYTNGMKAYFVSEAGTYSNNGTLFTSEEAEGFLATREEAQAVADKVNEKNGWTNRDDKDVVFMAIIDND